MFVCSTCCETFVVPVWECGCGHHNHVTDTECGNCHTEASLDALLEGEDYINAQYRLRDNADNN